MKLYLSNAMRGLPELNFPWFNQAAHMLRLQGHDIVNPVDLDHGMDVTGWTWHDYMRRDIEALLDPELDGIAMGPDWHHSKGAPIEKTVVEALGLGVYYVGPGPEFKLLDTPHYHDEHMLDVTLRITCDAPIPPDSPLFRIGRAAAGMCLQLVPAVETVDVLIHKEGYGDDKGVHTASHA